MPPFPGTPQKGELVNGSTRASAAESSCSMLARPLDARTRDKVFFITPLGTRQSGSASKIMDDTQTPVQWRCPVHYRAKCSVCRHQKQDSNDDPVPRVPAVQLNDAYLVAPRKRDLEKKDFPPLSTTDLPEGFVWLDGRGGPERYIAFLDALRCAKRIAMDLEWPPDRVDDQLSVLQLAIDEKAVYLLDLGQGEPPLPRTVWMGIKDALRDPNIAVLGYGLGHDIDKLNAHFSTKYTESSLSACFEYVIHLIEIRSIAKRLFRSKAPPGLASLVNMFLQRSLNKSQQLSSWESRPLSPLQLEYAALDAWCLFPVLNNLAEAAGPIIVNPLVQGVTYFAKRPRGSNMDKEILPLGRGPVSVAWQGYLATRNGAHIEEIPHATLSQGTIEECGQTLAVELRQIVKCVALMVANSKPVLLAISGDTKADMKKVALRYAVSKRQVKMASSEECIETFGHAPGCLTPVGLRSLDIEVLFDPSLRQSGPLFCSSGSLDASIRVERVEDIVEACQGEWLDSAPLHLQLESTPQLPVSDGQPKRFVFDKTMRKAARKLRLLAVDAVYPDSKVENSIAWVLSVATREQRFVITRNKHLWMAAVNQGLPVFLMQHDLSTSQHVLEITVHFGIDIDEGNYLMRCTHCNSDQFSLVEDTSALVGKLPLRTLEIYSDIWACGGCGQHYWKGGAYDRATRMLNDLKREKDMRQARTVADS